MKKILLFASVVIVDAYQLILLISAHTNRHVQQINDVKADAGFPK